MNPNTLPAETIQRRRWLLVDDNQEILALMAEMVTRTYHVEVAMYDSPSEALAAFEMEPERYQCVITDLEMPGMNGFELCRRLQTVSPRIQVLLATGSHYITLQEARTRGFCGLLTKPFSTSTLQREIATLQPGK